MFGPNWAWETACDGNHVDQYENEGEYFCDDLCGIYSCADLGDSSVDDVEIKTGGEVTCYGG